MDYIRSLNSYDEPSFGELHIFVAQHDQFRAREATSTPEEQECPITRRNR